MAYLMSELVYDFDPTFVLNENFIQELSTSQTSALSLKHCCLSDEHTELITQIFKIPCVTKIDISFNNFSAPAIDRILDDLEISRHRLTDLEISGMGTKHQRARLRLLLLRNRKFNSLCPSHTSTKGLPNPSQGDFCCVACAHAELNRKFQLEISDLKHTLDTQHKTVTNLSQNLHISVTEKKQSHLQYTEEISDLNKKLAQLNASVTGLTREKDAAVAEGERLTGALEDVKKRETTLQTELKGERQQHRDTRKSFDKEREEFIEKIHQLEDEAYTQEKEISAFRKKTSETELELRKEISDHVTKVTALTTQIAALTAAKTRESETHMVQLRALVTENMSLTETTDLLRRSLVTTQGDLEALEGRAQHHESEIARLRTLLAQKDDRIHEISDHNDKLKNELRDERGVWAQRLRDLEGDMRDQRNRRDSVSKEILQVLHGSVDRVTHLIES